MTTTMTTDLFGADQEWEILNVNKKRWGHETYPTEEAAKKELRVFFKGVSAVRFDKFSFNRIK